jgi:hypothetical protein
MLRLSSLDLEEVNALADHTEYEHRWLIAPQTGQELWTGPWRGLGRKVSGWENP